MSVVGYLISRQRKIPELLRENLIEENPCIAKIDNVLVKLTKGKDLNPARKKQGRAYRNQ